MDNNDLLIRLRYALDIKNHDMVEIFKLGGVKTSKEDVMKMLTKTPEDYDGQPGGIVGEDEFKDYLNVSDATFESFLNGLIIFKRGKQEPKPGQPDKPDKPALTNEPSKNLLLKKVKIAMQLTSEDMLEILALAGVTVTKSEMSAMLRKEGHKNYSICGDRYARNFLKGLGLKYRK